MRMRHVLAVMLAASAMAGMSFSAQADNAPRQTSDTPHTQAAPSPKVEASPTKEKKVITTVELKHRGKELRAEIEQADRKLRSLHKVGGLQGVDISPATGKYIPPGTSFEDAEIILRNAGFELSPSPPRPPVANLPPGYRDEYRFVITGRMILYQDIAVEHLARAYVTPESPGEPHAKAKEFTIRLYYSSL